MSFLSQDQARAVQSGFGTPVYVYDEVSLEAGARAALDFPNAYGLTARYAMKALPTAAIVRLFSGLGLHIDASSGFEAERAMRAGVPPEHIQITAQEVPKNLEALVKQGVLYNACSLAQLRAYGEVFPGREVSVRINPGLGSGHNNRTNVGGPSSSFGIWHEYLSEVIETGAKYGLRIVRMHAHIGSGGDPEVWKRCARMSLDIAADLPDVDTLNLGGGFKVGRMPDEVSADLAEIGEAVAEGFRDFHGTHGRKLHLEIEPGTFLVANAGAIVTSVIDVVDTGPGGYAFIKVDSGMTEILRPCLYGAQHPIEVVAVKAGADRTRRPCIVVGHCCESGDIITPEPGNPEGLGPREVLGAEIGDVLVIGGAGAYCSASSAKHYNSFPEAPEVLLGKDGAFRLIRKRQTFDQMLTNEVS